MFEEPPPIETIASCAAASREFDSLMPDLLILTPPTFVEHNTR